MKTFATLLGILSVAAGSLATDPAPKPKLTVTADGFPSGHGTPEGAACDLARAFIHHDAALFGDTCIRLYAGGIGPADYAEFLKNVAGEIKAEAARKDGASRGPKSIGKVFAARPLTKHGPASYGYASFSFQDIMFVDVGVFLHNGERSLNRTLVIKDKDGRWYVHPMPAVSPLLSAGLNDEAASERDFADAYEIGK